MTKLYGRTNFLPGWSLDDLDAIQRTAASQNERCALVRHEAVLDLIAALENSGVSMRKVDLRGWTGEMLLFMASYAAEKDQPLAEIPVQAMAGLIERVRGIQNQNPAGNAP